MSKGEELSQTEIKELKKIINSIRELLGKNPELEEKLNLKSKFLGDLGEAIGITKISRVFGMYKLTWFGGRTKGFDVELAKKGEDPIRIQIKASSGKRWVFRVVSKIRVSNRAKVIEQVNQKEFMGIFDAIDRKIESMNVDYWLLVHIRENSNTFYWFNKLIMKDIIKRHYKHAVCTRKHGKTYNCYINKNGMYAPVLVEKTPFDKDLVNNNALKLDIFGS
jgi:hypothetical protein